MKLWGGNYETSPDAAFWEFNRSFPFDRRLIVEEVAATTIAATAAIHLATAMKNMSYPVDTLGPLWFADDIVKERPEFAEGFAKAPEARARVTLLLDRRAPQTSMPWRGGKPRGGTCV